MGSTELRILFVIWPVLAWGLVSGFYLKELSANSTLFWLHDFIGWILLPVACLVFIFRYYNVRPHHYGLPSLRHQQIDARVFIKLGIAILVFLTFIPIEIMSLHIFPVSPLAFSYGDMMPKGASGKPAALYLAVTAAFVEEIFYRGLLKRVIIGNAETLVRYGMYVVFSAILFGLNHWGQGLFKVVATTYLGIVASLIYLRFRNLWFLIGGHVFLNLLAA